MQQFVYGEGFLGKVRCDLNVFANGKVWDQVVELENVSNICIPNFF